MADDATLSYSGTFDGSQIIAEAGQADAAFAKMGKTATEAFDHTAAAAKPAAAGINDVAAAEDHAAHSAENLGFKHDHLALTYRQVNKEATEGSRAIKGALETINTGSLDAAGALDIFRIAATSAFHGPETLIIIGLAAGVTLLVDKLKNLKDESRDVKWFGDEAEVTERFDTLSAQYAYLGKEQERLNDQKYLPSYGPQLQAVASRQQELDLATKLKTNLDQQRQIESEIANIEADKVRLHGEAQVAESRTDNPVAKMQAQQNEVVQEKQREAQQLLLLIQEHGLQEDVLHQQLAVKARSKEEEAEEAKNKSKLAHLDLQLGAENALYKAKGDELVNIERANQNNLAHAKDEAALKQTKQEFAGQSDTEASPAYLKQLEEQKTATQKYNADIAQLDDQLAQTQIENGADVFTKKSTEIDLWYNKTKAVYEKQEQDEAKATGQSQIANQRLNERLALLTQQRTQKEANLETEKSQKVREIYSQETASIIQDSSQLFSVLGGHNEAFFLLQKGLAAASIIVNTEAAAAKIEAQLGILAAAGPLETLYAGMAIQLATVAATAIQGFEGGGYTGPGANDEVAGVVHKNEYVIPAADVARMGGPAGVASTISNNRGGDSYTGGTTNITINAAPNHSPSDIATAVANHPAFKDQYRLMLTQRQANYQRTQA